MSPVLRVHVHFIDCLVRMQSPSLSECGRSRLHDSAFRTTNSIAPLHVTHVVSPCCIGCLPLCVCRYCVDGVRRPCPPGRYGAVQRLSNASCTGSCTAGHMCAAGSTSPTQAPCASTAGFYCPEVLAVLHLLASLELLAATYLHPPQSHCEPMLPLILLCHVCGDW